MPWRRRSSSGSWGPLPARTGYTTIPRVAEDITGTLDAPPHYNEKTGHVESVIVGGQTLHANYKGPNYVLLRIARNVHVGDDVVVSTYGKKMSSTKGAR